MEKYKIEQIKESLLCSAIVPEFDNASDHTIICVNPAHKDTKPSLKWFPESNTYYCFGCGIRGDVFNLIGIVYGVGSFPEQVKCAAEKLGIRIDEPDKDDCDVYKKSRRRREILTDVAEMEHNDLLDSSDPDAVAALDYFTSRKITLEVIEKTKVGLFDLQKIIAKNKYSEDDLILAGFAKKERGKIKYVSYNKCFSFPIIRGNIVFNMQFRSIGNEKEEKQGHTES